MTEILLAIQMGQTNHGHCEILKFFLPTEKKTHPRNCPLKWTRLSGNFKHEMQRNNPYLYYWRNCPLYLNDHVCCHMLLV